MALFSEFKPALSEIARYLRMIATKPGCIPTTTAGTAGTIPEGFQTVTIVKTSANTDTTTITMKDGTTYPLTEKGEVFTDTTTIEGGRLPKYTIAGGTFKWHGTK
jgi:hypothetical protein